MPTIDDTAVSLGSSPCLVQNLGADALYLGGEDVTSETGFRLGPGLTVSIASTNADTYIVAADGDSSDVRILPRGLGLFGTETTP